MKMLEIALTGGRKLILGRRTLVMGILNVTPDSFSDGGRHNEQQAMEFRIAEMLAAGADLIDVGGESTRPGAEPVSLEEELGRVLPAITAIRALDRRVPVSIDTCKAEVASQALAAGADIINDVSALRFDPRMGSLAGESGAPLILMHMQGDPATMQLAPHYTDVLGEIIDFLDERIRWAVGQGVDRSRIIVDPGLGFGKTLADNLTILKRLDEFYRLGCPLLLGHSRKSFLGKVLRLALEERDLASAVLSAYCALQGIDLLRVHDVAKNIQAIRLVEAIRSA